MGAVHRARERVDSVGARSHTGKEFACQEDVLSTTMA